MRVLFLLLLLPLGLLGQPTPFYLADGLNDFSDEMIRGTNPVYVTMVNADSVIISTSADAFEHEAVYRRYPGETFLRRTKAWGSYMPNFVFLYDQAMVLVEEGGSYLLFLKDQNSANGMLQTDDKSPVLHLKDSLRSIVVAINTNKRTEATRTNAALNKKVVTAYVRGLRSRREDPALTADIRKWSRNTTTKVYIIDPDYYITRNYRGEVLNKNIPALIKYQLNGKCYVQWRAFGYEALGGGNFSKDLGTYNKNDYFLQATGAGGSLRLEAGVTYEVDCD